jgi:xanthine dehydrogenase accessory factor
MADVFATAERLERAGEAFAIATVVRAESPTSARAGDKAIFTERGLIEGWIGGSCAEPTALREAREALRDGQCRLVHISPDAQLQAGREGLKLVPMTCYSGGTIEIYIEPHRPAPLLAVYGHSPVASALIALARALKYRVVAIDPRSDVPDDDSVVRDARQLRDFRPAFAVVATHGVFDEAALEHALGSGAGYVGLVASKRRAASVRAALDAKGVFAGRVKSPAGLDLGALTPEEIALSIVAEVVAARYALQPSEAGAGPVVADSGARASVVRSAESQPGAAASCCGGGGTGESPVPQAHDAASCLSGSDADAKSCCQRGAAKPLHAILLAAGESRRMNGVNKLLLSIAGKPLVRRSVETLIASGIAEPIVVLGYQAELVREALAGLPVQLVTNEQFHDGQETSVRAGLAALAPDIEGAMICLGDQPSLTAADLRELQAAFRARTRGAVLVPMFQGQRGNPIVLARSGLEAILARGGKFGCRQLTTHHSDLVETYEMSSDHVVSDLDRPEDLTAYADLGP